MKRSEIFEEFAKIAQDKNIIQNDSKKSFKALENNPRADSLSISAIEALYGVKTPSIPQMEYKNNIMEVAHPNPVVLSPAYDRLNGLVENNIERQNINLRIVNKNPDGLLTQRKYAEKQFLLSLVRVANDLDNQNKEQLRKLADDCLETVSQQIKKEAIGAGGAIKSLGRGKYYAALAALIGGAWVGSKMDDTNKGYELNYKNVIAQFDDLLNPGFLKGLWGWAPGPELKQELLEFKRKIIELNSLYSSAIPLIRSVDSFHAIKKSFDKEDLAARNSTANALEEKLSEIEDLKFELEQSFTTAGGKTSQQVFETQSREGKGFLDSARSIFQGGYAPVSTDIEEILYSLPAYIQSVKDAIEILRKQVSTAGKIREEVKKIKKEKEVAPKTETEVKV